jgi:hypothetical protein
LRAYFKTKDNQTKEKESDSTEDNGNELNVTGALTYKELKVKPGFTTLDEAKVAPWDFRKWKSLNR